MTELTSPSVDTKERQSEQPKGERPLLQEAFHWYNNPNWLGVGFSPRQIMPLPLVEKIKVVLGRSITLEEVEMMVCRDGHRDYPCGFDGCQNRVWPIKWLNVDAVVGDAKLSHRLKMHGFTPLLDELPFIGSFYLPTVGTKSVCFCGVPWCFTKRNGEADFYEPAQSHFGAQMRYKNCGGSPLKCLYELEREAALGERAVAMINRNTGFEHTRPSSFRRSSFRRRY